MKFKEILNKVYSGDCSTIPNRLLCLDPGATTGWCLFENGELTMCGQASTIKDHDTDPTIDWFVIDDLIDTINPTHIVCEDYRIYAHKLDRHSFSKVPTIRLIGGIEYICFLNRIPISYQMAVQAKGFVTDDKLKKWDFWKEGMKHSRDAIRHGVYFLLVTNRPKGGK